MNYIKNNAILIAVMVISVFVMIFGGNNVLVKYAVIAIDLITIILLPTKYTVQNCFFMISFPAVYDIYGFKYLFNLTILITFIKLLLTYKKLDKKYMLLILLIIAIEVFDALIYKKFDFEIISFFSLIVSFMTLSLGVINSKKINVFEIYQSLFLGILISSLLSIFRIIYLYGTFNVSITTRFMGFFRDPNYYSFFVLLTGFSVFKIVKKYDIKINYYLLILIFGFLSLSKMFLLIFLLCLIVIIIQSLKLNKSFVIRKSNCFYYFLATIFVLFGIYYLLKNNYLKEIYDLYYSRFQNQDITSGRFDIASTYLQSFKSNPIFLIMGSSNTYYHHVISDYMRSIGLYVSRDMTAHNVFIELIASWGITGTFFLIMLIRRLVMLMSDINYNMKYVFFKNILIFIIIFISSFSLCFLSADCFPFVILFILLYLYDDRLNNIEEVVVSK